MDINLCYKCNEYIEGEVKKKSKKVFDIYNEEKFSIDTVNNISIFNSTEESDSIKNLKESKFYTNKEKTIRNLFSKSKFNESNKDNLKKLDSLRSKDRDYISDSGSMNIQKEKTNFFNKKFISLKNSRNANTKNSRPQIDKKFMKSPKKNILDFPYNIANNHSDFQKDKLLKNNKKFNKINSVDIRKNKGTQSNSKFKIFSLENENSKILVKSKSKINSLDEKEIKKTFLNHQKNSSLNFNEDQIKKHSSDSGNMENYLKHVFSLSPKKREASIKNNLINFDNLIIPDSNLVRQNLVYDSFKKKQTIHKNQI